MKFLKKIKYIIYFVLICSSFFFILLFFSDFFQIKKIEVISDKKINLVNKNLLINKNLLFLDQEKIEKQVVRENYLLEKAVVNKVWPSTLQITVQLYSPIASLIVNLGHFELSYDGRILTKKNDSKTSLPIINYYQKLNASSFQTGDWINFKDILKALYFISILNQIDFTPLTIDIKGQDMLVFKLKDSKEIVFSIEKSKEVQDYQLELIVRQFKVQGKDFKKIDLRFDKPIIQF